MKILEYLKCDLVTSTVYEKLPYAGIERVLMGE